jgi:hypothetical protein
VQTVGLGCVVTLVARITLITRITPIRFDELENCRFYGGPNASALSKAEGVAVGVLDGKVRPPANEHYEGPARRQSRCTRSYCVLEQYEVVGDK